MIKKWLLGLNVVDIICVIMEGYFIDFIKIKKLYKNRMWKVVVLFLWVIIQKYVLFQSVKEYKEGVKRMVSDVQQFLFLFQNSFFDFGDDIDGYCDIIVIIVEVIELIDLEVLFVCFIRMS